MKQIPNERLLYIIGATLRFVRYNSVEAIPTKLFAKQYGCSQGFRKVAELDKALKELVYWVHNERFRAKSPSKEAMVLFIKRRIYTRKH